MGAMDTFSLAERERAKDIRVFSGNSHPELALEICDYLKVPLSPSTSRHFSNDCMYVQLGESVRGKDVFIIQTFCKPLSEHIFELLMLLDTARSGSARSVHAVIPYYAYARSDKKDEPRISITARLVADLLIAAGATHIITMTLHSPQVHGFFSVPADHLTSRMAFAQHFQERDLSNTVIVSPDIGHAKRAAKLAKDLGVAMASGTKERTADDQVELDAVIGDVRHKDAIIFDDEVATGGSVVAITDCLRRNKVRSMVLACTHGVFSGPAIERLRNIPELEEIVTTNTVPIPPEKRLPNMTILSVGPIFGEAIRCNYIGQSVGRLFAYWPG
jgi:ribose-phosphate pyrophosphokinase